MRDSFDFAAMKMYIHKALIENAKMMLETICSTELTTLHGYLVVHDFDQFFPFVLSD